MPLLPNYDPTEEELKQLRGQAALAAGLGILGSGRRGGAALAQGGLLGLNAYSSGQADLITRKKLEAKERQEYEKQEKALMEESELRAILSDEKFMSALKGSPMLEQVSRLAAYNPDILKQLGGALTTPNDIVDAKDRAVPVNRFTGGPVEYGIPPSDIFTQGQQSARSRFEQEQQNYRHNTPQATSDSGNPYTNITTRPDGTSVGYNKKKFRMELIPSDAPKAVNRDTENTLNTLKAAKELAVKLSDATLRSPRSTAGAGRLLQAPVEAVTSFTSPFAEQPLADVKSMEALLVNQGEALQKDSQISTGDREELRTAIGTALTAGAGTKMEALNRLYKLIEDKEKILRGGSASVSPPRGGVQLLSITDE